jgi:Cu/Ag efflux protein CusF
VTAPATRWEDERMKRLVSCTLAFALLAVLAPAGAAQEKKKKAEKVSGDVGLLDLEKNYMILVTKEGKLVTLDFDSKTKVIMLKPGQAKMADVGLGSAASVEYVQKNGRNFLTKIEYVAKKGGE